PATNVVRSAHEPCAKSRTNPGSRCEGRGATDRLRRPCFDAGHLHLLHHLSPLVELLHEEIQRRKNRTAGVDWCMWSKSHRPSSEMQRLARRRLVAQADAEIHGVTFLFSQKSALHLFPERGERQALFRPDADFFTPALIPGVERGRAHAGVRMNDAARFVE